MTEQSCRNNSEPTYEELAKRRQVLEAYLKELGFTEMFGIGLWAKDEDGIVVDYNADTAKVIPYIDASFDNFVGFAKTKEELDECFAEYEANKELYAPDEDELDDEDEQYGWY